MRISPEIIDINNWEGNTDSQIENTYIDSHEIFFSPFQAGDIVNNTKEWVEKSISGESWSIRSYALHLFLSLIHI